jgi:hypothetical protein
MPFLSRRSRQAWTGCAGDQEPMLAGIRSGDPVFAERSRRRAMGTFRSVADAVRAVIQVAE